MRKLSKPGRGALIVVAAVFAFFLACMVVMFFGAAPYIRW